MFAIINFSFRIDDAIYWSSFSIYNKKILFWLKQSKNLHKTVFKLALKCMPFAVFLHSTICAPMQPDYIYV